MTAAPASARPAAFRTPATHWDVGTGRCFVVSIDTEEEFDWRAPLSVAQVAVTAIAAVPAFDRRLRAAGVVPAYMVDHAVAADRRASGILADVVGDDPVGAQLHPWINPPFDGPIDGAASFPGNLPRALEAAKIGRLVAAIRKAFGRAPAAYRAGRYGIGRHTAASLNGHDIRIDMSMRSRFDYRPIGGPDFRRVGPSPFLMAPGLVEVPLSTVFTGALHRAGARAYPILSHLPRAPGIAARTGLLSRVPLTPEGTSAREAAAAIRRAALDGERLLHLAFHSPSLVPGHTPYVRDAADRRAFDRWWDVALDTLAAAGFRPVSLAQIEGSLPAAPPVR